MFAAFRFRCGVIELVANGRSIWVDMKKLSAYHLYGQDMEELSA
jgi:hypothetical protein